MIYTRFVSIYDSSNVSKIAYNPKTRAMQIDFTDYDGHSVTYSYTNVPTDVFATVVSASSVGTAVNSLIVKKFKATKQ